MEAEGRIAVHPEDAPQRRPVGRHRPPHTAPFPPGHGMIVKGVPAPGVLPQPRVDQVGKFGTLERLSGHPPRRQTLPGRPQPGVALPLHHLWPSFGPRSLGRPATRTEPWREHAPTCPSTAPPAPNGPTCPASCRAQKAATSRSSPHDRCRRPVPGHDRRTHPGAARPSSPRTQSTITLRPENHAPPVGPAPTSLSPMTSAWPGRRHAARPAEDRWGAMVDVVAGMPTLVQRISLAHVPDASERCRGCAVPGFGTPGARWPCVLATLARQAREARDGSLR